jgi:TPR repeat protein
MLWVFTGFEWPQQHTDIMMSTITPTKESRLQVQAEQNTQKDTPSIANSTNDIAQRANDLLEQNHYEEAFPFVLQLAEQNNSSWQGALGNLYREGRGVKKDYTQAVYW